MNAQAPGSQPSTVLGRQLGDELRRHRERARMSTAQAAEALECTKGKISRIENGRASLRSPDLVALLTAYGVQDPSVRDRLGKLARTANRRRRGGWWNQYGSVLVDTYRDYVELEAIADSIRTFQAQLVPGLLQTAEYVRAVIDASEESETAEEVEQFVQVRLARQERLAGENPLQLCAVLAEGLLLQEVGGAHVMREQLDHLSAMSELPNITVQVLPFTRGAHASMFGPYVVLGFPQEEAMDVVLTDNPTGSMWLERDPEVSRYRALFDAARSCALSPAESRSVIRRRAKEHRA